MTQTLFYRYLITVDFQNEVCDTPHVALPEIITIPSCTISCGAGLDATGAKPVLRWYHFEPSTAKTRGPIAFVAKENVVAVLLITEALANPTCGGFPFFWKF